MRPEADLGQAPTAAMSAIQVPGPNAMAIPERGRVVVLRALPGLGDVLCAIPALRALRRHRRDVHITVIAHPAAEPHWRRFPDYVDDVVAFPGWPGLPDRRPHIARIPGFLAEMQARAFDLAIQLHGDGSTVNQILALLAARSSAGYYRPGQPCPDARSWLAWRDGTSEVRRGLRLMAVLGFPEDDESLEFPMPSPPVLSAELLRDAFPGSGRGGDETPLVIIHPGASTPARRWPPDRFAKVADGLADLGFRIAITGNEHERHLAAAVMAAMRAPAVDLTGRTSLDELAEVLCRSSLLVCNDTGVSHLAAALRVPSVVVFTDSEMARWAPLDRDLHRAVSGPAQHALALARRLARMARTRAAA
jgi:ADP-heptose:LPS heptosyltransferase